MQIRDLAHATDVSVQAVRDYETVGLLPPVPRLASGHRSYTARHLAALYTLRALIDAGYTRAEMTTIMAAIHRSEPHHAFAIVDRHHADIDHRHRQLATSMRVHDDIPSSIPSPPVTIGQAAQMIGVRTSTLRFWELQGLVAPGRNGSSGYREFSDADLHRLRTIRHLRSLGVSWEAIRAADYNDGNSTTVDPAEFGRERIVNARATALAWCYSTVTDGDDRHLIERIFGR